MSRIERKAAVVAAATTGGIAAFQLALALGAPWGEAAYGGADPELSTELRASSAVATVVWPAIGLIVLRRTGFRVWAPLPTRALPGAVWGVVGLAGVSVVMNAITPSRLERALWLPVSSVLLAAVLTAAVSSRREAPARTGRVRAGAVVPGD